MIAWQAAKKLTLEVYRLTKKFPKEEIYGLTSQMRRAAVSVMSNIAEGNQRKGQQEKIHFFEIAHSSLAEIDSQTDLAVELDYISQTEHDILLELINKAGFLVFRLIESQKNPNHRNNLNHPNNPTHGGFSLVELLVVVSIVSILSVSSVIGFGYLGNTLRAKEAAGYISDVVKQEELKILRGDFDKAVIHFLSDYLVVEEWLPEATETLSLSPSLICEEGYQINISEAGNLTKKDGEGEVLQVQPIVGSFPTKECVDFMESKDVEWNFQLTTGDQVSPVIRFVHFNLKRDNEQSGLSILQSAGSKAEIRSPYGRKRFFKNDDSPTDTLIIDVGDSDVRESITLQ